jgi:hypothetical protein
VVDPYPAPPPLAPPLSWKETMFGTLQEYSGGGVLSFKQELKVRHIADATMQILVVFIILISLIFILFFVL